MHIPTKIKQGEGEGEGPRCPQHRQRHLFPYAPCRRNPFKFFPPYLVLLTTLLLLLLLLLGGPKTEFIFEALGEDEEGPEQVED